ncbi:helix-turn-helix transcriptional regulator [Enterovirga rhinocerotis]|uniref:AlpA family transcriptional regulator n=1 Tax=Enterovirga rhinocerotis TaxID=1339210 RepID=A0A4R7C5F8_9HYPH|nr:AlpA family phage regulatory protein [Enterovirga rhinocerotis]TDR93794.1 AlpA family transcriptional regulator [Enterovirga rhinocerotis]
MQDRILRWPEVKARTGLSRTSVWREQRAGRFPPAIQISANAVGWRESDIAAWIASRTASVAA